MKKLNKKLLCVFFALTSIFGGCKASEPPKTSESFFAMNTYMTFTVYGENSSEAVKNACTKIGELEEIWSVTNEKSDIYAINNSEGESVTVSGYTSELIDFAVNMAEMTNGAFNPAIYPVLSAWGFTTGENRIPSEKELEELIGLTDYEQIEIDGNTVSVGNGMMLDMGAVAKGYAGDIIIDLLREQGVTSALLDIGGNIQALGSKPDGSGWQIGIRNPFSDGTLGVLSISDTAVVTSGNYERFFIGDDGKRYGHIIDPKSGYPAESGLASVTITGSEGKLCDALSTAIYVMGYDKAVELWRSRGDFGMILVTENGDVHITRNIEQQFKTDQDITIHIIK